MEKTKCNMHQKAGIGPRVQKKAACKRGMENYFPAHCLPLWEVRYPLLEQAGQQALHPVALALRGKAALEWAERGRRDKIEELVFQSSAPQSYFTQSYSTSSLWRTQGMKKAAKAGGFAWQVSVINTSCVWCPVIYHDRYLTYSLTQERRPQVIHSWGKKETSHVAQSSDSDEATLQV